MLLQVLPSALAQRCDACGTRRRIAFDMIHAGIELGDPPQPADPNVIALPPCDDCGSREFLNRVHESEPSGGDDVTAHRTGVNALHAALVASDRVAPTLRDYFATESFAADRASVPWTFSFEPVAISGRTGPAEQAFAAFLASRYGGA